MEGWREEGRYCKNTKYIYQGVLKELAYELNGLKEGMITICLK